MRFVCDAPHGQAWFQIETEAEAALESDLMNHAVEKHFRQATSGSIAVGSGILILQLHGFDEAVGACMPQSRRADGFDRHRVGTAASGVCRSTQTAASAAHSTVAPSAQTSTRSPAGLCGC